MRDVNALIALSDRTGVPVLGGSSLRYAPPLAALRQRCEAGGRVVSAFASGPHDFFNYGVHAAGMLGGFFGPGIRSVEYVTGGATDILLLEHRDGLPIVLQLSTPDVWEYSFFVAATTERAGVESVKLVCDDPFSDVLNMSLMSEFTRFARGEPSTFTIREILEEVTVCLAGAEARRTGRKIALDDIPAGARFDGAAFTRAYAGAGGWEEGAGGGPRQPSAAYSVD